MDPLELYRWAVQDPETQATVLQLMFDRLRPGKTAAVLREDFAGSAAESVAWIALREGRQALAIDLDGPTLDWAAARARRILGDYAGRIRFMTADVLSVQPPDVPPADLIAVLNFSICYFHDRAALRAYFQHAHRCLTADGLLVLNVFGGAASVQPGTQTYPITPKPRLATEAAIPPFDYHWEQRRYDALSARLDCRIHFSLPNPDDPENPLRINDAFCYDWRLWTLPELRELLMEAGFAEVQVWRHTYDPASGVFLGPVTTLVDLDSWVAYLVAVR